MTLRARLLAGFAIILATILVGGVFLVRIQEQYLIELVDRQLLSAVAPITRVPGPLSRPRPRPDPGVSPRTDTPESPISDLFLGVVVDGELRPLLQGQLLTDVPEVSVAVGDLERLEAAGPTTTDGANGVSRFRVMLVRRDGAEAPAIVALPLDSVDAAVGRLTVALGVVVLVIVVVLGLIVWWVERLGLRPIGRLTAKADAITRGERGARADAADPRTEAGKLALAFNLMLDERDSGEARLRRFLADASHELRTPLTSIRGYLDMWRDGAFDAPADESDALRRMAREAHRMSDLVEDMLLLARMDEGRPLGTDLVDLGELLEDAARDVRVIQPDRPIVVVLTGAPVEITGDQLRLEQVIGELVSNALAHTPDGTPIELAAAADREVARVWVSDGGPGMSPDVASHVFDRFVRGEGSRARNSGGAGLGLSIAKAIVEAHGGSITVDTAPDRGTQFEVVLPRGDAGNKPAQGRLAAPEALAPS